MPKDFNDLCRDRDKAMRAYLDAQAAADAARASADVAAARATDAGYFVDTAEKAMREYSYQHKLFIRHPVEGE